MSSELQVDGGISNANDGDDVLEPPMTLKHKVRLWGSLAILAAVIWVYWGIPALSPPPLTSMFAFVSEPIPEWINQGDPISYIDYNKRRNFAIGFPWLGLLLSFTLYATIFHGNRLGDEPDLLFTRVMVGGITLTILLLVVFGYFFLGQVWPLPVFGLPFLSMFMLWALTREPDRPKESEVAVVEKDKVPAS